MFKRIDHIELVTADPGRAVRFYTEVLGFKLRSRDSYRDTKPSARAEGEHLGYRMMALEVEDMQRALEALKAQGVEPTWGPKTRPGYVRAEIRDPDGNAIELRQWLSASHPPGSS